MKRQQTSAISMLCLCWALLAGGCATTAHKTQSDLALRQDTQKVLLMPMDIELSLLSAGGLLEPNAEWTATAKQCVAKSLDDRFSANQIQLLTRDDLRNIELTDEQEELKTQLIKLHETVGRSILIHQYFDSLKLPNKGGRFDWSLGPDAKFLHDTYGTDYALFVYLRDSYASTGRVMLIIAASALGVGIPGGSQIGFASLVDLHTGDIIWFNRLARPVGDLRNNEAAAESVKVLLADFPIR
jgi:hypothetical protein